MSDCTYSSNYQTDPSIPPELPQHLMTPPAAIKTFGILHIILASFGLLCNLGGLGFVAAAPSIFTSMKESMPEKDRFVFSYLEQILSTNATLILAHFLCGIVLTIMLLIAGIGLLKRKSIGRTASVVYGITSIGSKVVLAVVSLVYFREVNEQLTANFVQSQSGESAGLAMGGRNIISEVFSFFSSCIYPALTLILLNTSKVKEYLSAR